MVRPYGNVGGSWTALKRGFANIGGTWTAIKRGYANISGTWQLIFSGGPYTSTNPTLTTNSSVYPAILSGIIYNFSNTVTLQYTFQSSPDNINWTDLDALTVVANPTTSVTVFRTLGTANFPAVYPAYSYFRMRVVATGTTTSAEFFTNSVAVSGPATPNQVVLSSVTDVGTGKAFNAGTITITWTAPGNNGFAITGYAIQYSTDGTNYSTLVANTGTTAVTTNHNNLTTNQYYYYKVAAINSNGTGPYSSPGFAQVTTVPAAPAFSVTGTADATGYIYIYPTETSNGGKTPTSYTVSYARFDNGPNATNYKTGQTGYPITLSTAAGEIVMGGGYYINVAEVNSNGTGLYGTQQTAYATLFPLASPIISYKAQSCTSSTVSFYIQNYNSTVSYNTSVTSGSGGFVYMTGPTYDAATGWYIGVVNGLNKASTITFTVTAAKTNYATSSSNTVTTYTASSSVAPYFSKYQGAGTSSSNSTNTAQGYLLFPAGSSGADTIRYYIYRTGNGTATLANGWTGYGTGTYVQYVTSTSGTSYFPDVNGYYYAQIFSNYSLSDQISNTDYTDNTVSNWFFGAVPAVSIPVNTSAPTLSGGLNVGQSFTYGVGSWSNSPTSYDLRLYRGTAGVIMSETLIASSTATSASYTITLADFNSGQNYFKTYASATNAGGTSSFAGGTELGPITNSVASPPPAPTVTSNNSLAYGGTFSWSSTGATGYVYTVYGPGGGSVFSTSGTAVTATSWAPPQDGTWAGAGTYTIYIFARNSAGDSAVTIASQAMT